MTTMLADPVVETPQLYEAELLRLRVMWEQAMRDPVLFLTWFVYTNDQHDDEENRKSFPADRPHIEAIVRIWQHNRRLVIVKSRQMMMTWLFCALSLWDALAHRGRLIMLQSKKEEDAIGNDTSGDGLLGRCKYILRNMPGRDVLVPSIKEREKTISFTDRDSTLMAIAQGGDIIRTHTASGIFSDEAGYQPEFADAYTAAMPCVRAKSLTKPGAWFVALSTPNPGFFEKLAKDKISENT